MENFNELLRKAYEKGIVKSLDDIFCDDLSVEKINYLVEEETVGYSNECKVGDIVYVRKYYYEDGRKGRNHLFVIVGEDNGEHFGMLISSSLDKLKYKDNKLLEKNSINNLSKNSIVKTDAIYRLSSENIIFKIGEVEKEKLEEYKNNLKNYLIDHE